MATELDHDLIKVTMVVQLQSSSAVYDVTGGVNKLRSISVGYSLGGDPLEDKDRNFAFVTNNTTLETNRVVGTETDAGANKAIEHTMRYDIHFVMYGETGRDAEVNLDAIQKAMMEVLEEDPDIGGTVDDSYPERVTVLKPELTQGRARAGRIITLRCVKTTGA